MSEPHADTALYIPGEKKLAIQKVGCQGVSEMKLVKYNGIMWRKVKDREKIRPGDVWENDKRVYKDNKNYKFPLDVEPIKDGDVGRTPRWIRDDEGCPTHFYRPIQPGEEALMKL